MSRFVTGTGLLVAAGIGAACGGSGGGGTGNNPTTTIAKASTLSGEAQIGQVATALPLPLRVVVAEDGTALQGASVTWATTSGTIGPSPATTDANGIAAATWTLGNSAGPRTATATLAGAVGSPVTFNATATPGPAFAVFKVAGDQQGEVINTNFSQQAQVRVEDQFGNARPGTTVDWVGGGTVAPTAASSVTNAQGIASVTVAAQGNAGAGTVVASVVGVVATQTFNFSVGHRKVTAAANITFTSARNGTSNPAQDTIAAGQTVVWVRAGAIGHTVQSTGNPAFTSSGALDVYAVLFNNPGTYTYNCLPHGNAMTGEVVVE
jgi:plastocyanin